MWQAPCVLRDKSEFARKILENKGHGDIADGQGVLA
jgi:hypothetical protein